MLRRLKVIALFVLPLVMMIFILQNSREVDTTLLFVTTSMSQSALLLVTLLIGFVLGVLVGTIVANRSPKS